MSMEATPMKPSDTPRTDAASMASCGGKLICVHTDFASQLERELAEWKACAENLVEHARELAEVSAWKRGCGIRNIEFMAALDRTIAEFDRLNQKSSP